MQILKSRDAQLILLNAYVPRLVRGIQWCGNIFGSRGQAAGGRLMKKSNITLKSLTSMTISALCLSGCMTKGPNPDDPYEAMNRRTYRFNQAYDTAILKPAATIYKTLLPAPIRVGINNMYDNVNMIPTVANDLLQADFKDALKDSWRFVVNSTMGIAGILDVADTMGLHPRSNDLGITLAKWGDKHSPYFVIPFLGPSTFRDGMGLMFNYALLTPYPYLNTSLAWGLVGVRYVDLRSQMLDSEKLMDDALDKYAFMRDAYLQHRNYLITGEKQQDEDSSGLYVADDGKDSNTTETSTPQGPKAEPTKSKFPITTAQHAAHRAPSA